ncbi:hypothetical protein S7711_01915 [Stachybotrys chartarum IBT 7711]|uniref:Ribosome biogenesis protein NOP53 n=1 Tax=Stachybotrys chartarum (strain CBS 109288 / IBT 7711) TaxID=1280523 RepID=A0A084AMU2_STACB|nr:hypothetical protein S7711_01915 [Stachybotrys chartarum IBT 7711]KFA48745.1 hypothetical protein S40293_01563 [Stachybotrys chartarum IBT 40293]
MPLLQTRAGDSGEAPKQFNQPSRKGKKAWRKNIDVTEVEDGLVELNKEIIRGGVVKEKSSAELFTLDVKGDASRPKKLSKKTLRADEIIAQRSAVPAVSMRKRPGEKFSDALVPTKRHKSNWVSQKELARLKQIADGQHDTTVAVRDATYDIWDAPAPVVPDTDMTDVIPIPSRPKAPKTLKQEPIALTANGKHPRAVPKPKGGYSYNPVFTDYESRLAEESQKALDAERKRLEAEEAERQKKEAAARSAAEAEAAEARANLSEWEEDSEWEGFQSGAEDDQPSKKRPERKSQAQRNRIKRRKEEERLAKHKAAVKARRAQEQRIKEIAEELAQREQEKQLVLAGDASDSADSDVDDEKLRRRQLGKYKLPEKDLELVLPDELQESLRLLKPEGNLMRDRYRSMLVRGKVESRRHIPFKKQAKRKLTEKWTHKDFVL